MKLAHFQDSSRPAQDDRASATEPKRDTDRDLAPSTSYLPGKAGPSLGSRSAAQHVVFDPFTPSRRRKPAEGRIYTPYGV
jgi:hypothetical protein